MHEIKITSVEEYLDFIEQYKGDFYFRGQANFKWPVQPSIYRDKLELENESKNIKDNICNETNNILKAILKMQHYSNKTRLCDLTINPLVALYFCIEDENENDKHGSVYVFNKSISIAIDSDKLKVLLELTINDSKSLIELKNNYKDIGLNYNENSLEQIIQKNYIINYDIELSWSNRRSFLQGGTGIYFGFGCEEDSILRKGTLKLDALVCKIIIPLEIKASIRNYLKNYGFSKAVLYDEEKRSNSELKYKTFEISNIRKMDFCKIVVDINISDIIFTETDILNITTDVFNKYKLVLKDKIKIYMYIYYDLQDKRACNWIARPIVTYNLTSLKINYNIHYHIKRMQYFNEEVSINQIISKTDLIVNNCKVELNKIIQLNSNYCNKIVNIDEYKLGLKQTIMLLHKQICYDLQDISHGRDTFDNYYNYSNEYCNNVILIVNEQIIYIDRQENEKFIEYNFNMNKKRCDESWEKYKKAVSELSNSSYALYD